MDKTAILEKTQKALSPFETESIVTFLKQLSVKALMDNPVILGILAVVAFFAIIKRSKPVLLFLFTLLSLVALVHYTLPASLDAGAGSMLPFAFGCLAIGTVLIYFIFIKAE